MSQVKVYINQELTDCINRTMKEENIENFPSVIRWVLRKHYNIEV